MDNAQHAKTLFDIISQDINGYMSRYNIKGNNGGEIVFNTLSNLVAAFYGSINGSFPLDCFIADFMQDVEIGIKRQKNKKGSD